MTTEILVTDKMVETLLEFLGKGSYLSHPEVPYFGTINGDSEKEWITRVYKKALEKVLNG